MSHRRIGKERPTMAIHRKICLLVRWVVGVPYCTNENVTEESTGKIHSLTVLQTSVVEIKAILNDRPRHHISSSFTWSPHHVTAP